MEEGAKRHKRHKSWRKEQSRHGGRSKEAQVMEEGARKRHK